MCDADFEANNQDHANKVHSLPYVFLEPVCKEGDELLAAMMEEFIEHGSSFGPKLRTPVSSRATSGAAESPK